MFECKKIEMLSKRQTVEWFSGNNQTNGYLHHTKIVMHSIIVNLAWIKNKAICSKDYRIMTESLKLESILDALSVCVCLCIFVFYFSGWSIELRKSNFSFLFDF